MAMVKVCFPFHVIHGGRIYAPREPLEVAEEEAKKLMSEGAKVVESAEKTQKGQQNDVSTKKQASKPYKIPPAKKE